MLRSEPARLDRPVIFCLHYLAGSAREWTRVAELVRGARCIPVDLPGFGAAAGEPGFSVAEMAAYVGGVIRREAPERWLLAGHSMGAKVAAVLARSAEDGAPGLAGLEGLVLLAGSPPGPEPIPGEQREAMLGSFAGDAEANRADAQRYVRQNGGDDVDAASAELAVADALRMNRAAWTAWLQYGSREDWSERVGRLQTPALVIAGGADPNLGPAAQQALTAPHFARVRCLTLSGAKHLLPLERPQDVARSIDEHLNAIARERERAEANEAAYRELIASARVSTGTRQALVARLEPDDPAYAPVALDPEALAVLRAVVARVLPQHGGSRIDLAARIDAQLAAGPGDGWRFAALPPDAQAYRAGLGTLRDEARKRHGQDFADLDGLRQDELLALAASGGLGVAASPPDRLNAAQMRAWFEDVRGDAVKLYLAHPATLARIGYSGIAYGGDGEPKSGFARVGAGERESWEPSALHDVRAGALPSK